jgi:hypothetical protein
MSDIEALRLRLEEIIQELQRFETTALRLDPKLLNEMNSLITHLRERGFTADIVREGSEIPE